MSRTDKQTPYWVMKLQYEWRSHFVESHDHTKHACNFSPRNESSRDCYLEINYQGRNIFCGCKMCTGQDGRKLERRTDRQRAKRLLRQHRWDEIYDKRQWRY